MATNVTRWTTSVNLFANMIALQKETTIAETKLRRATLITKASYPSIIAAQQMVVLTSHAKVQLPRGPQWTWTS